MPRLVGVRTTPASPPAMPRHPAGPSWMSWTGLVYYGETVGFLVAWIAGIAVLSYSTAVSTPTPTNVDQIAAADSLSVGVDR